MEIQGTNLFEHYETRFNESKIVNERQTWLEPIVKAITFERENAGWKYKVNGKWRKYSKNVGKCVAIKTSHLKNKADFDYIHSQCVDYRARHGSYQRAFFGMLK